MLKLNSKVVAKWVEIRAQNFELRPLSSVVNTVLTGELSKNSKRPVSPEEIAETVEELVPDVAGCLASIADDYVRQGVDPSFRVEIEDGDHFYCCKDSPDRDFRRKLADMTPDGFEHFCKGILNKLMGSATVTGGPNDQCVDFYAVGLPLAGGAGPFPIASRLLVFGQAKRWKIDTQISPTDLREFVGAAVLRVDELRRKHSDKCGLLTPICFAFWATCDFSVEAREFAERMGLWYLNGKALSQLAIRIGLGEQSLLEAEAAARVRPT